MMENGMDKCSVDSLRKMTFNKNIKPGGTLRGRS
jgi:hypothetical protein